MSAAFGFHKLCHIAEKNTFPFQVELAPSHHAVEIADISCLIQRQEFIVCKPGRVFYKAFDAEIPGFLIKFRHFAFVQDWKICFNALVRRESFHNRLIPFAFPLNRSSILLLFPAP